MDSAESSRANEQPHEPGVAALSSKHSATSNENHDREQARDAEAILDKSDQSIGTTPETADPRLPRLPPFTVVEIDSVAKNDSPTGDTPNAPSESAAGAPRNSVDQVIPPALTASRALETSVEATPRRVGRTSIGRRISRGFVRFAIMMLIAILTGVAASSAWESHGHEAKQLVRTWASSLKPFVNKFLNGAHLVAEQKRTNPAVTSARDVESQVTSTAQNQPPLTAKIPAESVQQLNSISQDVTLVRDRLEQLAIAQEQMTKKMASLQSVEQEIKQKMSSPPLQSTAPHLPVAAVDSRKTLSRAATPQTPAHLAVLADWWITGTRNGNVFVEGKDDIYEAAPGVPLPGLGKVERIVRQDGRWVVVTRRGIIVSRRDRQYFEKVDDLKNE